MRSHPIHPIDLLTERTPARSADKPRVTTTHDVSHRTPARAHHAAEAAQLPVKHVLAQAHHTVAARRMDVSAATQRSSRRAAHGHEAAHAHHLLTLKPGSHGPAVKALQEKLNHHGAHVVADGDFGAHTEAAVKHFQHQHHLAADGVVGPKTQHALHTSFVAPVHHVNNHDTSTVAGCARALLHSPNVTFWSGLSSGSDRKNFERLAHGHPAHVFATNKTGPSNVTPSLRLMQSLVEMSRHGSIQINALTGGTHSFNSNHYSGHAVDLSVFGINSNDRPLGAHHLPALSPSEISRIANKHGGVRNSETDHAHIDF